MRTETSMPGAGLEPGTAAAADLDVRLLSSPEDYAACVALQRVVWGESYETVPAALIKVSQRVGGVAAGAFGPGGRLAGFVFGLTGLEDGRLLHWSHMLAVHPAARDRGVGRRLKAFQLEAVRSLGVARVEWTFDPLVARNAHRNLNGLGVEVKAYVRDMYPGTGSELHAFGTDRLIVFLTTVGEGRSARPPLTAALRMAPVVNGAGDAGEAESWAVDAPAVRIRIPSDIEALAARDIAAARAWRVSTRGAFQRFLGAGHRVVGFQRESADHGAFVLARGV